MSILTGQQGSPNSGFTEGGAPPDRLRLVRDHFDRVLDSGLASFGPDPSRMWMASLDTRTGRYPKNDQRPAHIGKRVYRNIDAPRGCSLYWDQPAIVAAHALADQTGEPRYSLAADAYVRDFLERCVSGNGLFLWGNHYYFDAFRGQTMRFGSSEKPSPCDPARESGHLHEMRPIGPAWETLWRVDEAATERAIRAAVSAHVADPQTGVFNRHADAQSGCAFLEAGGILVEAAAWLYRRTGDQALIDLADRVADFSFRHRGPESGLLENNPTVTRWDKHASTTEVGLWAGCLLRAAAMAEQPRWVEMADVAMTAWLRHGWDDEAGRYYGQLRVADGTPILGPRETRYEPLDHSDLWRPLFPTHDYPMSFAETCLTLYGLTSESRYLTACRRWLDVIDAELPARDGQGAYAEHYGRCLHFVLRCRDEIQDKGVRNLADSLAERLAAEAVDVLWDHGMFRTHPGEHRYDAVDGVGYLLLALLRLEQGREPEAMGLGW